MYKRAPGKTFLLTPYDHPWMLQILEAIRRAEAVVVFMSEEYAESARGQVMRDLLPAESAPYCL
jgi:hypothetical protein